MYDRKNNKILIVAPYGFNDRMSNFVEYVSARLLAKNSWEVRALVKSDININVVEKINGIKIFRYKSNFVGFKFLLSNIFIFLPSIVHIHNLRNNRLSFFAGLMAKLIGAKLFFTEYGLLHDHYIVSDRDNPLDEKIIPGSVIDRVSEIIFSKIIVNQNIFTRLKNYLFHWSLTHADKVIFVSKHNLPIANTLNIKNGVYLPQLLDDVSWEAIGADFNDEIKKHHLEVIDKMNHLGSAKFGFFIGQLKLRKGWDVLLRAIPLIDANIIPFFVFVSASSFRENAKFKELINELNISDRVIFLGKVLDRSLLKNIYDKCSVVIVPSRYEGFGLAVTEAYEVSKPLVAADVAAINETVVSGENGILFPKEDYRALARSIIAIATDDNIRLKVITGGLKTLDLFKSDNIKNQWIDFYNNNAL